MSDEQPRCIACTNLKLNHLMISSSELNIENLTVQDALPEKPVNCMFFQSIPGQTLSSRPTRGTAIPAYGKLSTFHILEALAHSYCQVQLASAHWIQLMSNSRNLALYPSNSGSKLKSIKGKKEDIPSIKITGHTEPKGKIKVIALPKALYLLFRKPCFV